MSADSPVDENGEQRARAERAREEEKMAALAQLGSAVAHQFNNLMTVVRGNLELIEDAAAGDERITEWSRRALDAAGRAIALQQRLLVFAGRRAQQPVEFDVAAALDGLAAGWSAGAPTAIALDVDVAPGVPRIIADPDRFDTAMAALLDNAAEALGGEGRIRLSAARDAADSRFVVLSVTDDGPGMTAEVRRRAIEPFFSTKTGESGAGLGLSMAYGFARQSGGDIDLVSSPQEGTTVSLRLPADGAAVGSNASDPAPVIGGGETVLVVDDEAPVRDIAADLLATLGYRVVTATDAAEALAVLAGGDEVDLVFSDVVMPGDLDGAGLAERIRADRPGLPVVLTSGFREPFLDAEADGFTVISKPYRREALARVIRAALDKA